MLRHIGDVLAVQLDKAVIDVEAAGNRIEQGRFSGAVGTDDCHEISVIQMQGQPGERLFGVDSSRIKGF